MITAVDTNILLDVFHLDSLHGLPSTEALRDAYDSGAIVV